MRSAAFLSHSSRPLSSYSSSFLYRLFSSPRVSSSSSFENIDEELSPHSPDSTLMPRDRYNKSSGPVAQLVKLIHDHQPVDSRVLYDLATENSVPVRSRTHMKTLLQSVKSKRQHPGSHRNGKDGRTKVDGFIRADRLVNEDVEKSASRGRGGKKEKTRAKQATTYKFALEERGRKHLEKLGLVQRTKENEPRQ